MDNKKIIIVVIIFSLVLLSVIGTYAYFSTNVSSSGGALNARTAKFSISLDVRGMYTSNQLIPMANNLALTGYDNGCVDNNNFDVCQVYSITLENNSGTGQDEKLLGTIMFNINHVNNLSYMLIEANKNVYTGPTAIVNNTDLSLGNYVTLRDGESKTLYLIIWLSDSGNNQTSVDAGGNFNASVTYTGVTGDSLSSMITGTIN